VFFQGGAAHLDPPPYLIIVSLVKLKQSIRILLRLPSRLFEKNMVGEMKIIFIQHRKTSKFASQFKN
jgi:hypothetical protein